MLFACGCQSYRHSNFSQSLLSLVFFSEVSIILVFFCLSVLRFSPLLQNFRCLLQFFVLLLDFMFYQDFI